jgi:Rhodopirellula transposase DDE domain
VPGSGRAGGELLFLTPRDSNSAYLRLPGKKSRPSRAENLPPGQKVSDEQMAQINLTMESFHGEWNYTIAPLQQQLKL